MQRCYTFERRCWSIDTQLMPRRENFAWREGSRQGCALRPAVLAGGCSRRLPEPRPVIGYKEQGTLNRLRSYGASGRLWRCRRSPQELIRLTMSWQAWCRAWLNPYPRKPPLLYRGDGLRRSRWSVRSAPARAVSSDNQYLSIVACRPL